MSAFAIRPQHAPPPAGASVGEDYLDHGAKCDGKTGEAGCILSDAGRARLLADFRALCDKAGENYKGAILEIKVELMLEKDPELPWYVSLAIEAIGTHLMSSMVKGLIAARAAGVSRLQAMGLAAAAHGEYNPGSWAARAETALSHVTPEQMSSLAKSGWTTVRSMVKGGVQHHVNHEAAGDKHGSINYLDELRDGCDEWFRTFALTTSGQANDAEIVALWQGMMPPLQTVGAYKAVLKEKLAGFKKSGVNQIGHAFEGGGRPGHAADLEVNTKVVLVRDIHGQTKPWFQREVKPVIATPARGLEPGYADPRLDRPVPSDFADVAIERQIATWGAIETIDDGYVTALRASGQDVDDVRRRLDHKPTPQEQAAAHAFGHYADSQLQLPAAPAPLPAGSIFDPLAPFGGK